MKKTITAFLLCSAMIFISGCVDISDKNEIYSDNIRIAQSNDSYMTTGWSGRPSGNEYSVSATFTGMDTIWRYDAENDIDVELAYLLSVSQGGKAKLVLITPDDEVIILSENTDNTQNAEMEYQTVSLKKGNNRIKIVGYDKSKLEFKLHIEVGTLGTD
jgi:outer membrane lipoprotein-sorting protein